MEEGPLVVARAQHVSADRFAAVLDARALLVLDGHLRTVHASGTLDVPDPATDTDLAPAYRAALAGVPATAEAEHAGRLLLHRVAPDPEGDGVVAVVEDVTAARALEDERRALALRLRLTVDHAPIGEALVELDGRWRTVNAALVSLLGYPEEELLALTFQDITHPDDLDLDLDLLGQLVTGEVASYRMQKRYLTASGDVVWVLLSVALARDESGAPAYFVSQILDISEEKRQLDTLRDLTAVLAHDLRTPATAVSGFAELLLEEWDRLPETQRRETVRRVVSAARSMNALLESSLNTFTTEARGEQAQPQRVVLVEAVDAVLELVPHPLHTVATAGLRDVAAWVDPTHLRQVLTNLLTNAVKYGGEHVTLTARTSADTGTVTVALADDGPGVPAAFVPQLFERFTRSDAARSGGHRGSGLGLHLARRLARLNGGELAYEAGPGGGACFVLTLPAAPDS